MGLEEKLPSGILLTTVEKVAGYARKSSVWPATFGLACCAMELISTGGPRHDLARFGMERAANPPPQAELGTVVGGAGGTNEFHGAAGQAERGRPHRNLARVAGQLLDTREQDPAWQLFFNSHD